MPIKAYYNAPVANFLEDDVDRILGVLTLNHHHALDEEQRWAWVQEISVLKSALFGIPDSQIFLEFYIPRMGKRVDALLIAEGVVFVIEFKAGARQHVAGGFDQVEDYALDLKNFHEGSHTVPIVPVLVSTDAEAQPFPDLQLAEDLVASPVGTNAVSLGGLISTKAICFVTGVPGSGKTLAGLNIATRRSDEHDDEHAVFLSGNGPLVDVLREALARDKVRREEVSKKAAEREGCSFIQNIHHFRDHYVANREIPVEKVVIFDEAQRAWNREQTSSFMQRKRGQYDFDMSEPEFLISVMDRHSDWCTIVCLIGGGQEINTGEAGISEWISTLQVRFSTWEVHVSPRISLPEYGSEIGVGAFLESPRVHCDEHLHLAVSMRSFRAEGVSGLIGHILNNEQEAARAAYSSIEASYKLYLTGDLSVARTWLRNQSRGTERFGLVASSGAQRLRPEGIHIKAEIVPPNWFLNDAEDVRSSYYMEDVASELAVQGLELDWVGVCWDGDCI